MTSEWRTAVDAADVPRLERMIASGTDIDPLGRHGRTAPMRAARAGEAELVGWLLGDGADRDHTAKFGLSATMLAAIAGHAEVVRLLVGAGADLGQRGSGPSGLAGTTARDLALDRGDPATAAALHEAVT